MSLLSPSDLLTFSPDFRTVRTCDAMSNANEMPLSGADRGGGGAAAGAGADLSSLLDDIV